ncbi:glycerate kinase [Isoptericola cucumis]|uniref:Universal stress protein family protein n=1 Tax=Isoptericola cucumis TaxID=1776856 RepID=A0ABQ2BEP0_9MICO|nr:glycerate kinase [Isoptericola cucumis]GGI12093.1 hypothetical protein GCM10007368_39450 [Isoptericola cucumis]
MHVLLCVEDDADVRSRPSAHERAAALAAAWRDGAPRCAVTSLVLPAAPRAGDEGPRGPGGSRGASAPGVFVPVTALGLTRVAEQVSAATARLREQVADADLAVAAVPVLDGDGLHGGVVAAVAGAAAELAVPVVVLAGRVAVTRREWSGAGVSGVHELGDDSTAVVRVARTWAPSWA